MFNDIKKRKQELVPIPDLPNQSNNISGFNNNLTASDDIHFNSSSSLIEGNNTIPDYQTIFDNVPEMQEFQIMQEFREKVNQYQKDQDIINIKDNMNIKDKTREDPTYHESIQKSLKKIEEDRNELLSLDKDQYIVEDSGNPLEF